MTNKNRKKRHYPVEFKEQALELLASGQYRTMAELERELGISPGLLKGWRRNAELRDRAPRVRKEPLTAAEAAAEIQRLERENARLRQEREILKKAMAIFSKPSK